MVLHEYSWPVKSYGALCYKSVHGLTFHSGELTVRFKLKGGSMSLMNLKQSFKPISRNFIKPCHLSSEEKTQSVFCANCKTFLVQLNIERYGSTGCGVFKRGYKIRKIIEFWELC